MLGSGDSRTPLLTSTIGVVLEIAWVALANTNDLTTNQIKTTIIIIFVFSKII